MAGGFVDLTEVPAEIAELDRTDPLAAMRERFILPTGVIYLDGHSLGALPRACSERSAQVVDREWGQSLIGGWNDCNWITLPSRVGGKIAKLIGAESDEVIATDSTSVNLFKLIVAAMGIRSVRKTIVTELDNFPTDSYLLDGVVSFCPDLKIKAVSAVDLFEAIDYSTGLVLLSHVHYKSGSMHDMEKITAHAHSRGALILWDLCHSTGAMKLGLNDASVDLAVGCGYKYLSGGPGAPAFLFVARRLQEELRSPLSGWMGHASPFTFERQFRSAPGVLRFLCGTPSVLGLSVLDSALDVLLAADMEHLTRKGRALGDLFIRLIVEGNHDLELASPRESTCRGNQVAIRHPQGYAIIQAMIAQSVIGDFRAPDVMRFGFAPLYVRYQDVWRAAQILFSVLEGKSWMGTNFSRRATVT